MSKQVEDLLDIIEDQAFATTKLVEMHRELLKAPVIIGKNLKILGDKLTVNGNALFEGELDVSEVKEVIISGSCQMMNINMTTKSKIKRKPKRN